MKRNNCICGCCNKPLLQQIVRSKKKMTLSGGITIGTVSGVKTVKLNDNNNYRITALYLHMVKYIVIALKTVRSMKFFETLRCFLTFRN